VKHDLRRWRLKSRFSTIYHTEHSLRCSLVEDSNYRSTCTFDRVGTCRKLRSPDIECKWDLHQNLITWNLRACHRAEHSSECRGDEKYKNRYWINRPCLELHYY